MSYRNVLCVDNRCNTQAGCAHRGKLGAYCDFSVEQRLCEILQISWYPQLDIEHLLTKIQDKLSMLPDPDDYNAQVNLAKQRTHPAILTAPEEDKDNV